MKKIYGNKIKKSNKFKIKINMGLDMINNYNNNIYVNIELLDNLIKDSYAHFDSYNNTFDIFKSKYGIFYIIYTNNIQSIISYNLIKKQKINEIKKAHNNEIINIKHYLDKVNSRDLIISISSDDTIIKIWNVYNNDCLLIIKNVDKKVNGNISSACLINYNNQNYILTCNYKFNIDSFESIKVYDFKGKKIKELKQSKDNAFFIDSYYDNKLSTFFILTSNKGYCKSYDYNKNQIYHTYYDYYDNYNNEYYNCIIINKNNKSKSIFLLGSNIDEVSIWNFYSGELINKIKISEDDDGLYGINLWKNNYLFVGCINGNIKLLDLEKRIIINNFIGHNSGTVTIKIIIHPIYGECLITQGDGLSTIKLWKINFKEVNL